MKEDLAMTDEQTEQYDALVRKKMEKAPNVKGYYANYVFPYYATKYNKKKMKAVLDADQYQLMKMILGPSETYGAMFDQQGGNVVNEPEVVGIGFAMLEAVGEIFDGIDRGMDNFVDGVKKAVGAKE